MPNRKLNNRRHRRKTELRVSDKARAKVQDRLQPMLHEIVISEDPLFWSVTRKIEADCRRPRLLTPPSGFYAADNEELVMFILHGLCQWCVKFEIYRKLIYALENYYQYRTLAFKSKLFDQLYEAAKHALRSIASQDMTVEDVIAMNTMALSRIIRNPSSEGSTVIKAIHELNELFGASAKFRRGEGDSEEKARRIQELLDHEEQVANQEG